MLTRSSFHINQHYNPTHHLTTLLLIVNYTLLRSVLPTTRGRRGPETISRHKRGAESETKLSRRRMGEGGGGDGRAGEADDATEASGLCYEPEVVPYHATRRSVQLCFFSLAQRTNDMLRGCSPRKTGAPSCCRRPGKKLAHNRSTPLSAECARTGSSLSKKERQVGHVPVRGLSEPK